MNALFPGPAQNALATISAPARAALGEPVDRCEAAGMTTIPIDQPATVAALERLFDLAKSDTGQARRVADFLLAWWNGPEHGDFAVGDLFGLDAGVASDLTTVIGFLGQHPGAIYPDDLGFQPDIEQVYARWRAAPAVRAAV